MAMVMKALTGKLPSLQNSSQGSAKSPKVIRVTRKELEEMLTCKVCLSRYSADADGKKLPRDLDCGHVFCQSCLKECCKFISQKNQGSISCPLCKKKTTFTGNNVLLLPVNRQYLGLIKNNAPREQKTDSSSSSSSKHHHRHHQNDNKSSVDELGNQLSRQRVSDTNRDIATRQSSTHSTDTHKAAPIVAKSALKKTRTLADKERDRQRETDIQEAIIEQNTRLHPPHRDSVFNNPLQDTGGRVDEGNIDEEFDLTTSDVEGIRDPFDHHGNDDDVIEIIDDDDAGVIPEGGRGARRGGVDYVTILRDLLHMQPTSATYSASFGKYSQVRTQPGGFSKPTKIACSVQHKLLIVDPANETIQVFSPIGECLAIFNVADITGACFLDESSLAVASIRGVEMYRLSGRLVGTIPVGPSVAIARYKDGFVAAQQKRLSVGQSPTTTIRLHTISGARSATNAKATFNNISDVAVGAKDEYFCVLDGSTVLIVDYDGNLRTVISPAHLLSSDVPSAGVHEVSSAASQLFQPFSLAVDPVAGHVIVSDSTNRYVSSFAVPGGSFVRCLVNMRDQVENDEIRQYGVTVNRVGQIFILLRAQGIAECAIYKM